MIITGIICVSVGLFMRLIAIKSLKGNFSLQIKQPEKIITTGIYRLMRHPSYFGSLMIILGLGLINEIMAIMAISFFFFLARIVNEEQILDCSEYREYKKRTGIFWPKLKRKKGV